jgi:hypothetical protein
VPFLDYRRLPPKVFLKEAEETGVVILTALAICISSGLILRVFLDEIRHLPLKCPYCASSVAGYPLTCPLCHGVPGRRSSPPHP